MKPYLLQTPFAVAFSGGRTSAFMLRRILDAHDGVLPDNARVVFNNTGLEHPKTYKFVNECAERWGVDVVWLEYDINQPHKYRVAKYGDHSENGEPFEMLIDSRQYLPNPVSRFCTVELKIRTNIRWIKRALEWDEWDNAVGIRADEPRRVARMKGDVKSENVVMPLALDGVTEKDVIDYWQAAPFDLDLPYGTNLYGNCVMCFLKKRSKIETIMQKDPCFSRWWVRQEEKMLGVKADAGRFRNDRPTYAQMLHQVTVQGQLFEQDEPEYACLCGD